MSIFLDFYHEQLQHFMQVNQMNQIQLDILHYNYVIYNIELMYHRYNILVHDLNVIIQKDMEIDLIYIFYYLKIIELCCVCYKKRMFVLFLLIC
jgi:hypothetical protein